MSTSDQPKNVIVVGGGAGGSRAAHLLSKSLDASKFKLIVIDPRPSFIILPATVRLNVASQKDIDDAALVPLKDIFAKGNGTYIQGKVVTIEMVEVAGGHVVLSSGDRIQFEALLLAPGSTWIGPLAFPESEDDIKKFFESNREAIKAAHDVVLVGGGAVGTEIAGEIGDVWPDKAVTIVHRGEMLMNTTYTPKFRKALQDRLAARSVRFVFDDHIDGTETIEGQIKTRKGTVIKADLVLSTTGWKPNTEFISKSLGSAVVSDNHLLKVQPTLQLLDHPNIFAVGDAIDFAEQKQYAKAIDHASVAAANITAYLQGKPLKSKYNGSTEMILVSIGKTGGVAYVDMFGGIVLGDWFVRLIKSKTLLVGMLRGNVGL